MEIGSLLPFPVIVFWLRCRLNLIYYFFANFAITTIIITTIATAINIPTPIPALKMPSIASQEVKENEIRNSIITASEFVINEFVFFMIYFF
jgi:hypothetical protein